jgi:nucleoid-associated protein YgaU
MPRYQNRINREKTETGKSYYSSAIPVDPIEEQIQYQHRARIGDRWDTLAYKYLGNPALWYVIANANSALNGSIFIKPGSTVIIPQLY